ncbi:MAG: hypothetical protein KDA66_18660, partial [Planctomycetaceae bacterium]|nr:hypothetical protein [Planctomycetaceae bacterium]
MSNTLTGDLLFDTIAVLVTGVLVLHVHRKFYLDARMMELRFKAFALRDRLSMLAVKGVLQEHDPIYEYLQRKINVLILGCEHLSLRMLVRAIKDTQSEDLDSSSKAILRSIR